MNSFTIDENRAAKILETRRIGSLQDLQSLLCRYVSQGKTNEEIIEDVEGFQWDFKIQNVEQKALVNLIIKKGKANSFGRGKFENVILYESEREYLSTVPEENVRKILYLALIHSKWENHNSGWIHYSREMFFLFWGIKISEKEKSKIIHQCSNHGMMLRVVGSKNPIVCFKINFRADEGAPVKLFLDVADIKTAYSELFERGTT